MNNKLLFCFLSFSLLISFSLYARGPHDGSIFNKLEECKNTCSRDCFMLARRLSAELREFSEFCQGGGACSNLNEAYSACKDAVISSASETECARIARRYCMKKEQIDVCAKELVGDDKTLRCLELAGRAYLSKEVMETCFDIMIGQDEELTCLEYAGLGNNIQVEVIRACEDAMIGQMNELECIKIAAKKGLSKLDVDYCDDSHVGEDDTLDCLRRM